MSAVASSSSPPPEQESLAAPSSPSTTLLSSLKATSSMKETLGRMREALLCPLCSKLLDEPVSLSSCSHTFCKLCIERHCCNNYACPVKGCELPMTLCSSGKKYRQANAVLTTVIQSYEAICRQLSTAPDDWWKTTAFDSEYDDDDESTAATATGTNHYGGDGGDRGVATTAAFRPGRAGNDGGDSSSEIGSSAIDLNQDQPSEDGDGAEEEEDGGFETVPQASYW